MKKLLRAHHDLPALHKRVGEILGAGPYNVRRQCQIKKLQSVAGRTRPIPSYDGKVRFRYDILGHEVLLLYCGLRREDTYA